MKDLITLITTALVDYPGHISVRELIGNRTTVLELKVAEADTGKVIGRHGRTEKAMRTILAAALAREDKRTVLEVVEYKREHLKHIPSQRNIAV